MKKYQAPNELGMYGNHGGKYVAETLIYALEELENNYNRIKNDSNFWNNYNNLLENYIGGPSPMYFAERLTNHLGGARIYLKREDLNHTGSHKINNTLGQILLAVKMNKKKVIAETGAGQHGVATATVAAKFGLECKVYMGKKDIERQSPNVFRMKLLGAEVVSVDSGSMTLKDAMNEAMRAWITNIDDTFYVLGTAAGPHPYPQMVRDFQAIIGNKTKEQMQNLIGREPDILVACVGGGSNAIGLFYPYIEDENVRLVGVEAGGLGLSNNMHAAPISSNSEIGVLHGFKSYFMQDSKGQILDTHSISAGLDYPGVGPEHSYLHDLHRAEYTIATDDEALNAFQIVSKLEGIIPALESSHALAWVIKEAPKLPKEKAIVVNVSGRGDKDIDTVAKKLGINLN